MSLCEIDLSAAPKGLNAWLECLLFVFGAVLLGLKVVQELRGKEGQPPNGELQTTLDHVNRRVGEIEKDISAMRRDFSDEKEKNELHMSARSRSIYEKMDEQNALLRQEMNEQSVRREQQIENLREEINRIPERVLNMLNNIQALHKPK